MFHSKFFVGLHQLTILLALSACGGGGGESRGSAATVRTLVYAPFECTENDTERSSGQELRIRQGEGVDVTVTAATETYQQPPVFPGACSLAGTSRSGLASLFAGGIQRLGVSPDGSRVVFEKTNRFSVIGLPPLASDREGFFVVSADGSGLRHLGPASRESLTRLVFDPSAPNGIRTFIIADDLSFSADGLTIAFTDRGAGPEDEDGPQIVTIDLVTGMRTQVTRLPHRTPEDMDTGSPRFLADGTITFWTTANPNGLNPYGDWRYATIKPNGADLELVSLPISQPGSTIRPTFVITGDRPTSFDLGFPCKEIYLLDHQDVLQLTNFCRPDTFAGTQSGDGQHAFFIASADPFGTNPSENCEIFSIDRLGINLRQLTSFSQGEHSQVGCLGQGTGPPGCDISAPHQDPVTGAIVFESSCDPFGSNPNGGQIFAMNPDGTHLRQLTDTRGFTTEADGTVDVELPGPSASTAQRQ